MVAVFASKSGTSNSKFAPLGDQSGSWPGPATVKLPASMTAICPLETYARAGLGGGVGVGLAACVSWMRRPPIIRVTTVASAAMPHNDFRMGCYLLVLCH